MYNFNYNKEKDRIELGNTGKSIATRDRMGHFIPDLDPSIGAPIALYVFNGMNRDHGSQFGTGDSVANSLNTPSFEKEQPQYAGHNYSIEYNEYTDTIRVKETNHLVMKKNEGQWVFDFSSGAPEQLIQKTFLHFHKNSTEAKSMTGPELLNVLTGRNKPMKKEYEGSDLSL